MALLFAGVLGALPASAAPAVPGQKMGTFPAPSGEYELSLESCTGPADPLGEPGCPFVVRLVAADKEVDRVALFHRACGPLRPDSVDRRLGADRQARAWISSGDRCQVGIAARAIELAPKVTGLIVTQQAGREYSYRTHHLFVADGGKLRTLWRFEESMGGKDWATTTVLPGGARREDVAFIHVSRAETGVADTITARRLHYDRTARKLVPSTLPDARSPLFLIQVGRFKTAEEALETFPLCLQQYDVVPAKLFPRLRQTGFFRGVLLATKEDLDGALADLAACRDLPPHAVFDVTAKGVRPHAPAR